LSATAPSQTVDVRYEQASAAVEHWFAPVVPAAGGLLSGQRIKAIRVGGQQVGGVASYAVKPGLAKSTVFQDQYVVQLVHAVTKDATPPQLVRIDDHVVALSKGAVAVAGWFEGDIAVLVYRAGSSPDLTALAAAVRSHPSGR
jgi:hypothetical protein